MKKSDALRIIRSVCCRDSAECLLVQMEQKGQKRDPEEPELPMNEPEEAQLWQLYLALIPLHPLPWQALEQAKLFHARWKAETAPKQKDASPGSYPPPGSCA